MPPPPYPGVPPPGPGPYPGMPPPGSGPYPAAPPPGSGPYPGAPGRPYPFPAPPPPRPRGPWAAAVPEGAPFHRLARTAAYRWWRPPLSLALIVAGAFAASLAVLVPVMVAVVAVVVARGASGGAFLQDPVGTLLENPVAYLTLALASLALLTPVVLLAAWAVERRPIGSVSSVRLRLRGRWLWVCAAVALAAQVVGLAGLYVGHVVAGPGGDAAAFGWTGWGAFLPAAAVTVLLVPFQAAAEEYVFRGWLLQAVGCYLRNPWPGIVVSALIFAGLHGYGLVGFLDVALFGVAAGWLAVRTGGLEAPIALHVLHNLAAILPAAAAGQLEEALRVTQAPPYVLAGTAVELVFFAAVVVLLVRRLGVTRLS